MSAESIYLHGSDPAEQARLARLNDLLNASALRELQLAGGERILDVGSGLGQLTRGMARAGGSALGIERDPRQLAEAQRLADVAGEAGLVEFRPGDATNLPLRPEEWGTFDLAHTRFLLEHVTDPLAVVRQMVRAVRPGGRIVLQDDGHDIMRASPEPPGFTKLWTTYLRTYDRVGNDPFVGHRLVGLLAQAGAKPRRNTWLFFGSCAGQSDMMLYVENLIHIIEGVRGPLLALGEFDGPALDAMLSGFREWGQRPDAALWYAVAWAEGIRPTNPTSF